MYTQTNFVSLSFLLSSFVHCWMILSSSFPLLLLVYFCVIIDKLWIVDIMFDVKYLAALHARCSIIVLVVIYVAKRDELDLS